MSTTPEPGHICQTFRDTTAKVGTTAAAPRHLTLYLTCTIFRQSDSDSGPQNAHFATMRTTSGRPLLPPIANPSQLPREQPISAASFIDINAKLDLALWSADGLKFSVSRLNILDLSSVLRNMVARELARQGSHLLRGLGYVELHLPEDRRTLADLLLCCYPSRPPRIENATDTFKVYKAAIAYKIHSVQHYCLGRIHQLAESESLTVFAIAMTERNEALAMRAARASLSLPLVDLMEHRGELYRQCTIKQFQNLYEYRIKCQEAASRVARTPPEPWPFVLWDPWSTPDCMERRADNGLRFAFPSTNVRTCCSNVWWRAYMDNMVRLMRDIHVSGRSTVKEKLVCANAVRMADACGRCRSLGVPKALEDYHELLVQMVCNGIAQVTWINTSVFMRSI